MPRITSDLSSIFLTVIVIAREALRTSAAIRVSPITHLPSGPAARTEAQNVSSSIGQRRSRFSMPSLRTRQTARMREAFFQDHVYLAVQVGHSAIAGHLGEAASLVRT